MFKKAAPPLLIGLTVIAVLAPFSGKAFSIDDTLFLWTARQILKNPFDFYGFTGNWLGFESPAVLMIKNPPLTSYYIAVVALFSGFTERALHIAFMIPAVLAALGTYSLATHFTKRPLSAALAAVATPAFIVSSTSVMCDTIMLAFWVWAVVLWVKGIDEESRLSLVLAGLFIALSGLSKYYGISLIPLIAAYSLCKGRKGLKALIYLLIPSLVLAAYDYYTGLLYGWGLLLNATVYASHMKGDDMLQGPARLLAGLAFTGGCVITALFFAPVLWRFKALALGALAMAGAIIFVSMKGSIGVAKLFEPGTGWPYIIQLAAFSAAGLGVFAAAFRDLIRRRDAASVLLALWIFGAFAFSAHFNWSINARSILPIAPAFAILAIRAAEDLRLGSIRVYLPIALSLAVSLLVAWGDMDFADMNRKAAEDLALKYPATGRRLWFQGHWGFQYYMEGLGWKAVDWKKDNMEKGDIMAIPLSHTAIKLLPPDRMALIEQYSYKRFSVLTTMAPGTCFYASQIGAIPFAVSPNEEEYAVMVIK